jgi:hypothetical protein
LTMMRPVGFALADRVGSPLYSRAGDVATWAFAATIVANMAAVSASRPKVDLMG